MKIENRVEALELELKILKNEIQATLLEIREQVLNHYYPELRAEEPARPVARAAANGAGNGNGRAKPIPAKPSANGGPPPFSDIFLQDLGEELDDFEDEEPAPPAQRFGRAMTRVALDDGDRPAAYAPDDDEEDEAAMPASFARVAALPTAKPSVRAVAPPPGPAKTGRRPFAALAAWVGDAVAKVGKVRTLQVIETYAGDAGALSAESESRLRQLVALAQDEEPESPAGAQEMMALLVSLDEILTDA